MGKDRKETTKKDKKRKKIGRGSMKIGRRGRKT